MRQYTDDAILDFIEKKFSENNPISLRAIANHFNTSHSQIKRILIRNNNYEEYLRRKEEIILQQEERNDDNCISQGESLDDNDFNVDEVLKSLRDVNDKINLDVEELDSGCDKYKDIVSLKYKSEIDYKNIWIRAGKKYFWELNYIQWSQNGRSAKSFGLSVGIPFMSFF